MVKRIGIEKFPEFYLSRICISASSYPSENIDDSSLFAGLHYKIAKALEVKGGVGTRLRKIVGATIAPCGLGVRLDDYQSAFRQV